MYVYVYNTVNYFDYTWIIINQLNTKKFKNF